MNEHTIAALALRLERFANDRDWMQFHTPKNLAMALSVEVAELSEIFQWLTAEQAAQVMSDDKNAAAVRDELADIMIYLTRISTVLGVDLLSESFDKVEKNELRFPPNSH